MTKICKKWSKGACQITNQGLEKLGDFFRVKGEVTNLLDCTLPHLQLRLIITDKKGKKVIEDIFHITDRKLSPMESSRFKIEGEWKRGMKTIKVEVLPYSRD
jgi:hypothetical protein